MIKIGYDENLGEIKYSMNDLKNKYKNLGFTEDGFEILFFAENNINNKDCTLLNKLQLLDLNEKNIAEINKLKSDYSRYAELKEEESNLSLFSKIFRNSNKKELTNLEDICSKGVSDQLSLKIILITKILSYNSDYKYEQPQEDLARIDEIKNILKDYGTLCLKIPNQVSRDNFLLSYS